MFSLNSTLHQTSSSQQVTNLPFAVNIIPSADASADETYKATLKVSMIDENGDLVELNADIIANISEVHDVQLTAPDSLVAVPGTVVTLPFSLLNTGNLVETVNINITVDGGWDTTPVVQSFTVPIDGDASGSFDIAIPALDGSDNLLDGAVHMANLTVYDPDTDSVYVLKRSSYLLLRYLPTRLKGGRMSTFSTKGTIVCSLLKSQTQGTKTSMSTLATKSVLQDLQFQAMIGR